MDLRPCRKANGNSFEAIAGRLDVVDFLASGFCLGERRACSNQIEVDVMDLAAQLTVVLCTAAEATQNTYRTFG